MSEKKFAVQWSVEARFTIGGTAMLTEAQYREIGERLDARPRGFEKQVLAEELLEITGADIMRDGDLDDFEIEDFICDEIEAKDPQP